MDPTAEAALPPHLGGHSHFAKVRMSVPSPYPGPQGPFPTIPPSSLLSSSTAPSLLHSWWMDSTCHHTGRVLGSPGPPGMRSHPSLRNHWRETVPRRELVAWPRPAQERQLPRACPRAELCCGHSPRQDELAPQGSQRMPRILCGGRSFPEACLPLAWVLGQPVSHREGVQGTALTCAGRTDARAHLPCSSLPMSMLALQRARGAQCSPERPLLIWAAPESRLKLGALRGPCAPPKKGCSVGRQTHFQGSCRSSPSGESPPPGSLPSWGMPSCVL